MLPAPVVSSVEAFNRATGDKRLQCAAVSRTEAWKVLGRIGLHLRNTVVWCYSKGG